MEPYGTKLTPAGYSNLSGRHASSRQILVDQPSGKGAREKQGDRGTENNLVDLLVKEPILQTVGNDKSVSAHDRI